MVTTEFLIYAILYTALCAGLIGLLAGFAFMAYQSGIGIDLQMVQDEPHLEPQEPFFRHVPVDEVNGDRKDLWYYVVEDNGNSSCKKSA